jgi:hypothetical protein
MVTCTIPDQDGLDIRCQGLRQLRQKQIHDRGVESWCDQAFGLARLSTRCRQHVDITVLRLSHGSWSRTRASPYTSQGPLLAEAGFVFVENMQSAVGVLRLDLRQPVIKFFLNSSCAAGSAWGCCGRGISDVKPIRCNRP